jgi:hypothetical protein
MWLHDVLKIGKKNELVDKRQKKMFGVKGGKREEPVPQYFRRGWPGMFICW